MRLVLEVERWGELWRWEVYPVPNDIVIEDDEGDAGTRTEFSGAMADACLRMITRVARDMDAPPDPISWPPDGS